MKLNFRACRIRGFPSLATRRKLSSLLGTRNRISAKAAIVLALLIFIISFSARSLHAVDLLPDMYTIRQPLHGLTYTYDLRATYITSGHGLLGPYDVKPSDTFWLARAPGYSIYLSAIYESAGRDFFAVQSIQNAINSLSSVLIFIIAGIIVSWRVGFVSGIFSAISQYMAHNSNLILPDSLCAFPILAGVLLLTSAYRYRRHLLWLYILAGTMFGLACWLRSQAILMPVFIALLLGLISIKRSAPIKHLVAMIVSSFLVIVPITIRNYYIFGEIVPINIGLGMVLWEGIGEASDGRFGAPATDEQVARQEAISYDNPKYRHSWSTPDGIKRDRDRIGKSIVIITEHPFWYAGVMLKRMQRMLGYSTKGPLVLGETDRRSLEIINGVRDISPVRPEWQDMDVEASRLAFGESISWARPIVRSIQKIIKATTIVFLLPGAVIIFAISRRRAMLILMVPLYYLIFQSAMHTEARYTVPMQYFLLVIVAIAWVATGALVKEGLINIMNKRAKRSEKAGA
ncbi:MAG: glycosyltransferase family 39 protein [Blastocatellia bacterium]|nr:glycosyltransferase family 39 protein [Blastocatellia bacterium]